MPHDSFVFLSEPSGPPQQVVLSEVTSKSVKVSWGPVLAVDRNGIIRGYKVNFEPYQMVATLLNSSIFPVVNRVEEEQKF